MSQKVTSNARASSGTTIEVMNGNVANGASQGVSFSNHVQEAMAAVTGFSLQYSDGEDHNVKSINVNLSSSTNGNTVDVQGTAMMEDNNNHQAPGTIYFQVIAVVKSES